MKTTLKTVCIVLFVLFGVSETSAQFKNNKVVGDGNVTTKTVSTSNYSGIKVIGSMDVHLEKGTEGNISVTTDSNIHEYVEIEVDGNSLEIRIKKNTSVKTKHGIHVTVPFQDLSEVLLVGSGDIDTKNTITGNELELSIVGSGDVKLDVDVSEIDAKITGSGDMILSGKTGDLEVKISGSGDFEGSMLTAQNADTYISGSGDAEVNVKNNLKARVNGSGDVRYTGNPTSRDTKVSGSGTIKGM
jgi:hypothetical protein